MRHAELTSLFILTQSWPLVHTFCRLSLLLGACVLTSSPLAGQPVGFIDVGFSPLRAKVLDFRPLGVTLGIDALPQEIEGNTLSIGGGTYVLSGGNTGSKENRGRFGLVGAWKEPYGDHPEETLSFFMFTMEMDFYKAVGPLAPFIGLGLGIGRTKLSAHQEFFDRDLRTTGEFIDLILGANVRTGVEVDLIPRQLFARVAVGYFGSRANNYIESGACVRGPSGSPVGSCPSRRRVGDPSVDSDFGGLAVAFQSGIYIGR